VSKRKLWVAMFDGDPHNGDLLWFFSESEAQITMEAERISGSGMGESGQLWEVTVASLPPITERRRRAAERMAKEWSDPR
jgi:hypothetical protein